MVTLPDPNKTEAQSLYYEVRERALELGISTYDEYMDLVEEVVNEKVRVGEISQHDDWEQTKRDVEMKWPELEAEIAAAPV